MLETKNIAKYGALITIILAISKVAGFIRELIIAVVFGATRESDIFKIATTMPNVLFSVLAAAMVTTFIPVFSNVKNDREKANDFFNNILNIVFLLCLVLSIIGIAASPVLIKLFASGFQGSDFTRTVNMTKIVMPSIIFLGLSGLYTGYLQSYGVFLQPALTGISADIVIIVGIIVFQKYGISAGIVATLLSSVAQVLIQRPFMREYRYKFRINFNDENVRRMLMLAIPILISTAVSQFNLMVDRTFASRLTAGSISVVDYASKVSSIINQVFIVSITTVLYPMLTERFSQGDRDGFVDLFIKSINLIVIIVIPLIFGIAVLSTPVVKLLLQHGKFDSQATAITSQCLRILAFGALGYSIMDIVGKIFFSSKDTITPMVNGFIMIGLNVVMILILVPIYGVTGLALATTVSVLFIGAVLLVELKHKFRELKYKKVIAVLIKSLVSGLVMALIVHIVFSFTGTVLKSNSNIILVAKLLIATIAGALVYTGALVLLKVEELKVLFSMKLKKAR
jgi:integral membrane protein MviN